MRLSEADIAAISRFLALAEHDFIQRYTRLRPRRDGPELIDRPNGECVFLDGTDCTIQPVKPRPFPPPRSQRCSTSVASPCRFASRSTKFRRGLLREFER